VLGLVAVEPCPWIDRQWLGSGRWSQDGAAPVEFEVWEHAVELPVLPHSLDEFSQISVAGLVARPVELTFPEDAEPVSVEGAPARAPRFLLRVAIEDGASLVWADSVPFEARGPVDVAFGGSVVPPSRERYSWGSDFGLAGVREGLELPLVLPRANVEKSVWVGADGKEWRSLLVAPDAHRVEVVLTSAASIRVLHDGPTEPTSFVVTQTFPKGDVKKVAITSADPVVVDELAAASTRVWIERTDDRPTSRIARVELPAGELTEIDLRAASDLVGLGGLRIVVRATPEVLALANTGLEVGLQRSAGEGADYPWDYLADLERDAREDDAVVYTVLGLEPVRHRVQVEPFGAFEEVDVVAGEVLDVDVPLDRIGFVRLEIPPDYEGPFSFATLTTTEEDRAARRFVSIRMTKDSTDSGYPVVCDTYVASTPTFGGVEFPGLVSDPFVVEPGVTTVVHLRVKHQLEVRVVAVDATTGEPVGFGLDFWVGVAAIDVETGERVLATTSFRGSGDSYHGITWTFDEVNGPVRVEVPENPFWTVEEVEPQVLLDGSTVELRAHPK
ncbi:MAG: hypothetical protein R3F34_10625, partial [Planctomycetota bacterium]